VNFHLKKAKKYGKKTKKHYKEVKMSFKVKLTEPLIDLSQDEDFIIEDMITTANIMKVLRDIKRVLRMQGKTEEEIEQIMKEIKVEVEAELPEDKRFLIH